MSSDIDDQKKWKNLKESKPSQNQNRKENLTSSMSRHLGNSNASPSINPQQIYEPASQKDKVKPLLLTRVENNSGKANHPTENLMGKSRQGYAKMKLQKLQ
jgi:hypothetical protein